MDEFSDYTPGLESPATDGFDVIPNDGADLEKVTRAVHIGSGGSVRMSLLSGAIVTLSGLSAGALLPVRVKRIYATGTTAGDLVALL